MNLNNPKTQAYMAANNQFEKLSDVSRKGAAALTALRELSALGQKVTKDDVFKKTMELLQAGHTTSREAAQSLSSMPPGGPALVEWIGQHAEKMAGQMDQVNDLYEQTREQLAQASLSTLMSGLVNEG